MIKLNVSLHVISYHIERVPDTQVTYLHKHLTFTLKLTYHASYRLSSYNL